MILRTFKQGDLWPFRADTGIIVDVLGNSAPDNVPLARIVVL